MMDLLIIGAPAVIGIGFLIIGILIGKNSRKVKLQGVGAKEAFAYFLRRERHRHIMDINQINRDLEKLKQYGIYPPDYPLGIWLEVK